MEIEINSTYDESSKKTVFDLLNSYNISKTKQLDGSAVIPLEILIRDDSKNIIGGIYGASFIGTMEIRAIVVDEQHRNKGIGIKLMEIVEEEARIRKCSKIILDTFSFQAPEFYQKLGYKTFGSYVDKVRDLERFYLIKEIVL